MPFHPLKMGSVRNHRAQPPGAEPLGIGERLRNAREARGLSLSALEATTHIRGVYLQALEEERFDHLPGRVYALGFLRTYARALGLDPDDLVHAYPKAFDLPAEPILSSYPAEIPIRPTAPPSRLRRIVIAVGVVVAVVVVILGVIGVQQLRQFNAPVPEVQPPPPPPPATTPPRSPEVGPAPSTPEEKPVEVPAHPAAPPVPAPPIPLPPPPPETGVEVVIEARGTCWLRILADGVQVFQGLIQDGDVRRWRANTELTVRVGRPSAVTVYVNGQTVATRPKPGRQVWEETFKTE